MLAWANNTAVDVSFSDRCASHCFIIDEGVVKGEIVPQFAK